MDELWQLYSAQNQPLKVTASKQDILRKGLLHGAAHVWIVRNNAGTIEVLLQKRAIDNNRWPGMFDISAAGHIDKDEEPFAAALRETKEEIGLDVEESQIISYGVYRTQMTAKNGAIENEFQWLYLYVLPEEEQFTVQETEVDSVFWKSLADFQKECLSEQYVPHGKVYYELLLEAIDRLRLL